jgi:hypothetical protein
MPIWIIFHYLISLNVFDNLKLSSPYNWKLFYENLSIENYTEGSKKVRFNRIIEPLTSFIIGLHYGNYFWLMKGVPDFKLMSHNLKL